MSGVQDSESIKITLCICIPLHSFYSAEMITRQKHQQFMDSVSN